VIDQRQALEDAQGDAFLPGTPSPAITIPTTVYRTAHPPPRNLLPVDFYRVAPAPRHVPLVIMLVFTQLSVGAFIVDAIVSGAAHAFTALVVCAVALLASVFHIGRPLYAFRAVIGLRTSWMSREIVAFGAFAMLAIAYALVGGAALRDAVAAFGVVGIACSVMIYHATRRVWWSATIAGFKFFMTAALLGIATSRIHDAGGARELAYLLVIASAVKGLGEAAVFVHLRDKRYTELRRSAVLMTRDLRGWTAIRFAALALGGIALPLATADGGPVTATASLVLLLVGELCERTLFFAAASAPGMPKGLC
jgi:DMSO reductase anchor subunit